MLPQKLTFLFIALFSAISTFSQSWVQLGNDIIGENAGDASGTSVSISSDGYTVAIGSPYNADNGSDAGHVRLYRWNGTNWEQKGNDIDGEDEENQSGIAEGFVKLSANGNTVVIGADKNSDSAMGAGHVRVYSWDDSVWVQKGNDIDGAVAFDKFGLFVDISDDGNTIAAAAPYSNDNGSNAGHVKVYDWNGLDSLWEQRGLALNGLAENDNAGWGLSLSGDGSTVAVGASGSSYNGQLSGMVRVFAWDGSYWLPKGSYMAGNEWDVFGISVSLNYNGSIIAVGAAQYAFGTSSPAYIGVYEYEDLNWVQKGSNILADTSISNGGMARAVSINSSGDTLVFGADRVSNTIGEEGRVRVYYWSNNQWQQLGQDVYGTGLFESMGASVSISSNGSFFASGAPGNDGNGTGTGAVRVYRLNNMVGSNEAFGQEAQIYPNPSNGNFLIALPSVQQEVKVDIRNIHGQLVKSNSYNAVSTIEMKLDESPGLYFVEVNTGNERYTTKVVVN